MDGLFHVLRPLFFVITISLFFPHLSASISLRMDLTQVDAGRGLSRSEMMRRAVLRSKARAAIFAKPNRGGPAALSYSDGEFLVDFFIGTPPAPFPAILDTGSEVVWTQCKPCSPCISQPVPLYDPKASRTHHPLSCSSPYCKTDDAVITQCHSGQCWFFAKYGDGTTTVGELGTETIRYISDRKSVTLPNLIFGCGDFNEGTLSNSTGIIGFSRGALSMPEQLRLGKFSYCLTPILENTEKGHLFLGSLAQAKNTRLGRVQTTPFIKNPLVPQLYYLSVTGITVGSAAIQIPKSSLEIKADGSGGFLIDSGSQYTSLEDNAFELLGKAFLAQVRLPQTKEGGDLELCWSLTKPFEKVKPSLPKLAFHFAGGADWDLPLENTYLVEGSLLCLALISGGSGSLLGNYQQQNFHVVYDLKHKKLSFVPAQCSEL